MVVVLPITGEDSMHLLHIILYEIYTRHCAFDGRKRPRDQARIECME